MQHISKLLFGISLQLFSLFCLVLAYAEKEFHDFAFPVLMIAVAAMIVGLIHTCSAYKKMRKMDIK